MPEKETHHKRSLSEATEKKMLRLEELAGIERIEVLKVGKRHGDTKIAIFHRDIDNVADVMRMIAECETLEVGCVFISTVCTLCGCRAPTRRLLWST